MFYLDGGNIYIHRGDSASFDIVFGKSQSTSEYQITAQDVYGVNWIPEDGTHVRFSVKCDVDRLRPVIQKDLVVTNGFVSIGLFPKDTSGLPFGEYKWDIRIGFEDSDTMDWNTPVNPMSLYICEVVGNV